MYCAHCGAQLNDNAKFCHYCGHYVAGEPRVDIPKMEDVGYPEIIAEPMPPGEIKKKKKRHLWIIPVILVFLAIVATVVIILVSYARDSDEEQVKNPVESVESKKEKPAQKSEKKKDTEVAANEPVDESDRIEVSDYLEEYESLVTMLDLGKAESWVFDTDNSYAKDGVKLNWSDYGSYSLGIENPSQLVVYGMKLGDQIEDFDETQYDWFVYRKLDTEYDYLKIINDRLYLLVAYLKNGRITSWYICNWPEGEDIWMYDDYLRRCAEEKRSPNYDPYAGLKDSDVFSKLPSDFTFTSGAGGWSTNITLYDDGTFSGQYTDYDMGDSGDGYQGVVYICDFEGKFATPHKVDNCIYSTKLDYLDVNGTTGADYIVDNVKYIYSDPYGFDDADEFLIYLPGCPLSKTASEFLPWSFIDTSENIFIPDDTYGIYNVGGMQGFIGSDLW